ncbi:hypothetical protein CRG98_047973 [Punica granatum]|uniref:Uncharacterized protein n=1 Tax=Punica granatum TaxID=22663 RepID=A0A2I0HJY9_PUNGR|nr:hypothetical protein CRG98_047973 [Punica granatum]
MAILLTTMLLACATTAKIIDANVAEVLQTLFHIFAPQLWNGKQILRVSLWRNRMKEKIMRRRLLARRGEEVAAKIVEERSWRGPREEEIGGTLEELGRQRREGGEGGGGRRRRKRRRTYR